MRHGKFELEKEEAVPGSVRFPYVSTPFRFHRIAKLNRIERIRFSSSSIFSRSMVNAWNTGDRLCKAAVKMFSKCFSNCSMDERFLESLKTLSSYIPLRGTEPHANSTFVPNPRLSNFTQHEFFAILNNLHFRPT